MNDHEPMTRTYRAALGLATPVVRWWGRLEVEGEDCIPDEGPLLVCANHDSYWDPVAIGIAAIRHRQIRALSKSSLWKVKGLDKVLDGMGQIPIVRGTGDADALNVAIEELRGGACVGIFPEGTRSLGRELRPRSGLGRLAAAVPEANAVCAAVEGASDIISAFPHRPRVRVAFFRPAGGGIQPGEAPADFSERIVAELRERAPISIAGRKRRKALASTTGD
jgi:1-acyl-sn-glycerol-3-phosphate acyltransferase